jgi:plasmid stabilization system protein ParE
MPLVYLPSTESDLRWLRQYYEQVFVAGVQAARQHIYATEAALLANPYLGRQGSDNTNVRSLPISRTPFVFVYRVDTNEIQILRVWDTRRDSGD